MYRLSNFLKVKIVVLWEQRISIKEISRRLGVARNTVRLWIRRHESTGDVKCNRTGRNPMVYTDDFERHREIVRVHTEEPFKSTRSTAELHGVSLWTVRKHLHAAGIHNFKPAKKIKLTEAHRRARLRFAQDYSNFDWENNIVIFTDEKTFSSDKDGRKLLWRRLGQRYNPKNTLPLRKSGRISLAYWGWMSSMGPGELAEVSGRMNAKTYVEVLRDFMKPTVRVAYPEGQIYLVQDNSSVHRSRLVTEWLSTQDDITVIDWPSKSPDLNPIENLWGQIVLNWDPSEVRSKQKLHEEVFRSWELMRNSSACSQMVSGMRERLEALTTNEGHPLRY